MTTNKYREGISRCRKCGRKIIFRTGILTLSLCTTPNGDGPGLYSGMAGKITGRIFPKVSAPSLSLWNGTTPLKAGSGMSSRA